MAVRSPYDFLRSPYDSRTMLGVRTGALRKPCDDRATKNQLITNYCFQLKSVLVKTVSNKARDVSENVTKGEHTHLKLI